MRRLAAQRNPKAETRDTGSETRNVLSTTAARPMDEGLAKRKKRPNGFFKRMNDDRLIEYTQEIMRENRITTRMGLEKADSGLYFTLVRRELLERVGFEEVNRNWAMMSDKELVRAAQEFMKEKGITTRKGLQKADRGLESVLRKRNLLEQVIPESKHEGYRERRDWTAMTDPELIEFTQEFMNGKGIITRSGLEKADSGLRTVLRKRNLLEQVIPESANELHRDWIMMSDERIVEFTQEFMKEKGITTRKGLQKADRGLESVLRTRNLLEQVIPESEHEGYRERRDWTAMTDPELIEFTQEFMNRKGIITRSGLEKADSGLRTVLRRRKLLERVFAETDAMKLTEGLDAVCTALEDFGEDG